MNAELLYFNFQFDPDTYEQDNAFEELKKERGYTYEDVIEISPDKLPNYEEKVSINVCQ